jgi:uncharacterized protein YcfJ
MKRIIALSLITSFGLASTGCFVTDTNEGRGTAIGAGTGAAAGAIIGNNVRGVSTAEGAVAGALIGGLIGNTQGRQSDRIQRLEQDANTRTVYVRNSNGSSTPVTLRRVGGDQWQGPRGEIYNGVPSPGQLERMYGY